MSKIRLNSIESRLYECQIRRSVTVGVWRMASVAYNNRGLTRRSEKGGYTPFPEATAQGIRFWTSGIDAVIGHAKDVPFLGELFSVPM